MTDNQTEDISSHPFFVRAEFPYAFIPMTDFTFENDQTHATNGADQPTSEFLNIKEKNEEEEKRETIDDQIEENDDDTEETNTLRINQPEYSQLLKDLDFSQSRMVDVTNLLSDETGNYLTADENDNQKKFSSDEKYQSLSSARSSVSSNEPMGYRSSFRFDNINDKKPNENLANAAKDIQIDLNSLEDIIQASIDTGERNGKKKRYFEEDDDTSKQATQTYDVNNNEQGGSIPSSKINKNLRFTAQNSNSSQDDNLSSIPRLNTSTNNHIESQDQSHEYPLTWDTLINGADAFMQSPTIVIFSQPINETHTTPIKEQPTSALDEQSKQHTHSPSKQKTHSRSRQLSASSETDSGEEYVLHRPKQKQHSPTHQQVSVDDDLNNSNTHSQQPSLDQYRPYTSSADILLRRLSNQQTDRTSPNRKKSHHRSSTSRHPDHEDNLQSTTTDTWLSMLEKLEREHKERLEKQQKQYEDYMLDLEEKMKRRCDEYLSTTNSLQESKSEHFDEAKNLRHTHSSAPVDSDAGRYRTHSNSYQYRPLAKDLSKFNHSTDSTTHSLTSDKRQAVGTNLSRSQSREDISNLRTELSTKHTKHISDLKLYYEHEIDELKNQLNRSKMGNTSNTTRQSIETIERINSENIRLHDEMKELRLSLKINEQENNTLKRQVEELHDQINNRDLELKNYHRTITDLEKQLSEAHSIKERQDDKIRHSDRQALAYRDENEKITSELNLTRERLLRLEERYKILDNENRTFRQPVFPTENNNQRPIDDHKFNSTMSLNMPTSREYGRFTLTTSRYSSSTVSAAGNGNLDSGRYTSNGSDGASHHGNSPRPLIKINDYINEKPTFPQAYVPPSIPIYSPREPTPNHHRMNPMPVRDLIDSQIKQSEQLEGKFDDLLKKKRDLESRINRIPTRGLTSTDRQLLDVLEREIERVEQQISSVKLELRKMNIIRTY